MKIYRWNGEEWYLRNWGLFHIIRNWFIWIGGWEKANGLGWLFTYMVGNKRKLAQPFPITLLGHRIVLYGEWFTVKLRRDWLVYHFKGYVYRSKDGTLSGATVFYRNAPKYIKGLIK